MDPYDSRRIQFLVSVPVSPSASVDDIHRRGKKISQSLSPVIKPFSEKVLFFNLMVSFSKHRNKNKKVSSQN